MEPVPETERMEAFRSSPVPSPVPSLRRNNSNPKPRLDIDTKTAMASPVMPQKPTSYRRSTDPMPSFSYSSSSPLASPVSVSSPTSSWTPSYSTSSYSTPSLPYRPRTASPLSSAGGHSRSRSAASLLPPISRTQSMPGFASSGHVLLSPRGLTSGGRNFARPESPSGSGSPSRTRIPRKPLDEAFPPLSPIRASVLDPEHHRPRQDGSLSPILGVSTNNTGRLRRPSSPLRSNTSLPVPGPSTPSSSPSYKPYDGVALSYGISSNSSSISVSGSLSSVPSTPTSARSRSPSISSLETIPDSPDAEERALEAERIAQLKADADAADSSDSKSRGSIDVPARGRTMTFGSKDKRKRWSVCGAERRGDIDLETIWED